MNSNGGAAGAAAAGAAVAQAVKASGTIVRVRVEEFRKLLDRNAVRPVINDERFEFDVDAFEALLEGHPRRRSNRAVREMNQPRTPALDQAPPGRRRTGIDPKHAHEAPKNP